MQCVGESGLRAGVACDASHQASPQQVVCVVLLARLPRLAVVSDRASTGVFTHTADILHLQVLLFFIFLIRLRVTVIY